MSSRGPPRRSVARGLERLQVFLRALHQQVGQRPQAAQRPRRAPCAAATGSDETPPPRARRRRRRPPRAGREELRPRRNAVPAARAGFTSSSARFPTPWRARRCAAIAVGAGRRRHCSSASRMPAAISTSSAACSAAMSSSSPAARAEVVHQFGAHLVADQRLRAAAEQPLGAGAHHEAQEAQRRAARPQHIVAGPRRSAAGALDTNCERVVDQLLAAGAQEGHVAVVVVGRPLEQVRCRPSCEQQRAGACGRGSSRSGTPGANRGTPGTPRVRAVRRVVAADAQVVDRLVHARVAARARVLPVAPRTCRTGSGRTAAAAGARRYR